MPLSLFLPFPAHVIAGGGLSFCFFLIRPVNPHLLLLMKPCIYASLIGKTLLLLLDFLVDPFPVDLGILAVCRNNLPH